MLFYSPYLFGSWEPFFILFFSVGGLSSLKHFSWEYSPFTFWLNSATGRHQLQSRMISQQWFTVYTFLGHGFIQEVLCHCDNPNGFCAPSARPFPHPRSLVKAMASPVASTSCFTTSYWICNLALLLSVDFLKFLSIMCLDVPSVFQP